MTTLNKKSGKGLSHGVVSELTAFFGIQTGHEEQLRAACQRFGTIFREADPQIHQKTGLRDMKLTIFDDGRRLMLVTTFESDWDPYIDDAVTLIGVEHWIDWMRHTTELAALRTALSGTGQSSAEELEQVVKSGSAKLKEVLQAVQVPAVCYFNDLAPLTVPQIKRAQQLEHAFEQVLNDPAAAQALQHAALAPLLELAAG